MTSTGWDHDVLDQARASARDAGSTDLIVVHAGEKIVDDAFEVTDRTRPIVAGHTEDGRVRQDVASTQKSVVSVLYGIAVGKGLVDIDAPVATWLGGSWDEAITVRHLLTMTSGLREDLSVMAPPGTVWDYNLGAAYHATKLVLAAAADRPLAQLTQEWLTGPLGMADTEWVPRVWNDALPAALKSSFVNPNGTPVEGLVTSGPDLCRFGLAVHGGGRVTAPDGTVVDIGIDPGYLDAMRAPSQELNPAYGLLWWVNGAEWSLSPKNPTPNPGPLYPEVPADAYAALGAADRMLAIVASLDLLVVRLGNVANEQSAAGSAFLRDLLATICAAHPERVA